MALDQTSQGREHGHRTAADDPGGPLALFEPASQQVGHESVMAGRAVVGGDLDVDPRPAEIVDSGKKRRGPDAVEQGRRAGDDSCRFVG